MHPDRNYLALLRDYYASHRHIPSYAELGRLLGLKSKSSVAALIGRLCRRGYLEKRKGRWIPTPRFFARPLVGKVCAGFASPAEELLGDAISIDEYLVEHPSATVLVKVHGDSMIGAGICDGDIVVVEQRKNANPGSIVVAVVDGEFTIKFLRRDEKGYYLQPANPAFPPIRPEGELTIFGVVVGQFRKYSA